MFSNPEDKVFFSPASLTAYDVYGEMYVGIAEYYLRNSTYRGLDLDVARSEYKALRLQYLLTANPFNVSTSEKQKFYTSMNNIDCAKESEGTMLYEHSYVEDAINLLLTSGIINNGSIGTQNFINGVLQIEMQVLKDGTLLPEVQKEILISTARIRHLAPFMLEQAINLDSRLNIITEEIWEENEEEEIQNAAAGGPSNAHHLYQLAKQHGLSDAEAMMLAWTCDGFGIAWFENMLNGLFPRRPWLDD